ncbi:MAG: signal peptidase II [Pseudomonadales bacterium]|nr:signal peptidase II [Pseudomonadales bacterium]
MSRWYGLSAAVLFLDRLSKHYISDNLSLGDELVIWPMFSIVRWHNNGAAFSFLSDAGGWQTWVFILLGWGFSAYIVWEIYRVKSHERLLGFTYAMILGGALGNLWGRMTEGYVVDFILVHYLEHNFPAFNLADSAIFLGACGWLYLIAADLKDKPGALHE